MAITKKQREEYRAQLVAENPRTELFFIDMLLDVYDKTPGFVDTLSKKYSKMPPKPETPPKKLEAELITCIPAGEFVWPEQDDNAKFLGTGEISDITEIQHEAHTAVTQSA